MYLNKLLASVRTKKFELVVRFLRNLLKKLGPGQNSVLLMVVKDCRCISGREHGGVKGRRYHRE